MLFTTAGGVPSCRSTVWPVTHNSRPGICAVEAEPDVQLVLCAAAAAGATIVVGTTADTDPSLGHWRTGWCVHVAASGTSGTAAADGAWTTFGRLALTPETPACLLNRTLAAGLRWSLNRVRMIDVQTRRLDCQLLRWDVAGRLRSTVLQRCDSAEDCPRNLTGHQGACCWHSGMVAP